MIKIVVIGSGNVAFHLIQHIESNKKLQLVQNYTRNSTLIEDADLYIIAVSDDAISNVSTNLNLTDKLIVHTSGSQPITILSDKNRKGVWYPLQTFSKEKTVDFKTIPVCIEAINDSDYTILENFTTELSATFYRINSEQRKSLHVAAVFVCNFVNKMYQIGADICEEHQIPFEILKPLIHETAQKIIHLTPQQAQTGPAIRNDSITIQSHMNFLENKPDLHHIYNTITRSIQDTYVQKL